MMLTFKPDPNNVNVNELIKYSGQRPFSLSYCRTQTHKH